MSATTSLKTRLAPLTTGRLIWKTHLELGTYGWVQPQGRLGGGLTFASTYYGFDVFGGANSGS